MIRACGHGSSMQSNKLRVRVSLGAPVILFSPARMSRSVCDWNNFKSVASCFEVPIPIDSAMPVGVLVPYR